MTLKEQIIAANKAYRLGRPIMSDIEFDNLCEQYEQTVSANEYSEFRDSLHEETGKVKHPFMMGSLDKLKIEEPQNILDWITHYGIKKLSVSAKVDGISCRLHYNEHNQLVSATTRGDGTFGQDITDKIHYVKGIVDYLNYMNPAWSKPYDIRGELVITNEDFEPLASTLKNPRNACAGIIGQKDSNPELLKHITFIAYEIMGGEFTKHEQLELLDDFGFRVVYHVEIPIIYDSIICEKLTEYILKDYGYPTDGVVISSVDYKAEQDIYRPKAQRAVKIANLNKAETVLLDVVWDKPSKNGRITPVGIVKPVEICGARVSRVTLNNIEWINQMNLHIGSKVVITRSNGVIPKIIEARNDGSEIPIHSPEYCPYCGDKLIRVGVDIVCPNKNCGAAGCSRIRNFIEKLGIKHVSLQTLKNLDIVNFNELLKFRADPHYKVQVRFENDLKHALFKNDEITIFKALPFRMIAEKTLDKIIDFYSWDFLKEKLSHGIIHFWHNGNLPFGVGALMLDHFSEDAVNNYKILESIMNDSRWNGKSVEDVSNKDTIVKSTGMTVCFTGKLENFSRKSANEFAKAHGFGVLDTVNKNLTFLVTNDTDSGSSKNKKAAMLGVKVINEQQFMEMCGC